MEQEVTHISSKKLFNQIPIKKKIIYCWFYFVLNRSERWIYLQLVTGMMRIQFQKMNLGMNRLNNSRFPTRIFLFRGVFGPTPFSANLKSIRNEFLSRNIPQLLFLTSWKVVERFRGVTRILSYPSVLWNIGLTLAYVPCDNDKETPHYT